MEDFSKPLLTAIKEYYIQDENDYESLELVIDIMRYLYNITDSWQLAEDIEEYARTNDIDL